MKSTDAQKAANLVKEVEDLIENKAEILADIRKSRVGEFDVTVRGYDVSIDDGEEKDLLLKFIEDLYTASINRTRKEAEEMGIEFVEEVNVTRKK